MFYLLTHSAHIIFDCISIKNIIFLTISDKPHISWMFALLSVVCTSVCVCIQLSFMQAVLGAHFVCLGCLSRTVD